MTTGFVYLDAALPGVFWDAKYATADNFTGSVVDGYFVNRVVGTREMADALRQAIPLAAKRGFALLLWDGYRPQRAVDCFLRWADAPEDGRTKARHYPNIGKQDIVPLGYVAAKSGHSRGSAIDLALCDPGTGRMPDMGGDFDLMDVRSHHGALELSPAAAQSREILREIMEQCGFATYEREWWHYALKKEPYVTKPFRPLELVARVKAQLRRYTRYNAGQSDRRENVLAVRGLTLNLDTHECTLDERPLQLTPIEFSILWLLCESSGKVIPAEEIFERVWGAKYLNNANNTVMVHIRHLREKLHDSPERPKYIRTVWGVGYKLEK